MKKRCTHARRWVGKRAPQTQNHKVLRPDSVNKRDESCVRNERTSSDKEECRAMVVHSPHLVMGLSSDVDMLRNKVDKGDL